VRFVAWNHQKPIHEAPPLIWPLYFGLLEILGKGKNQSARLLVFQNG
jgi:hypothetical protein